MGWLQNHHHLIQYPLLHLPLPLLQHLLSATSLFQDVKTSHVTSAFCSPCLHAQLLVAYISHHQQQQSPPQNHIHTTPPQNHESCIHRILLLNITNHAQYYYCIHSILLLKFMNHA